MLQELPGFFIISSTMPDSLTFVAWYFDDAQELNTLNYKFPGYIVFAHCDSNETTNAWNELRILQILESENVQNTLESITGNDITLKSNILLIRQHDDASTRHIVFQKILESYE